MIRGSTKNKPLVAIIMGSKSDWPTMEQASLVLDEFGLAYETKIVSAHRTPDLLFEFAKSAEERGLEVIIAGAGGAAHLPGMVASVTTLPVIGVPITSSNSIDGWDSVLSILQMPNGVPVATVALNAARNAGILAASIIGISNLEVGLRLVEYKKELENEVLHKVERLRSNGWENKFDN
jgi:5-(carboxyamino)imidazole ribonucleotide mutase